MKYIVLETAEGQKLPIIFPDVLTHACVAGAIQLAVDVLDPKKDLRTKQCAQLLEHAGAKPVSAGFVSLGTQIGTHGKSDSLELSSKPIDAGLIAMADATAFMDDMTLELLWAKIKEVADA